MDSNNLIQSRRSFIFTPGLKPEMFPKAIKSGTDMVCVELEDGIAPQDKNLARKLAIKLFETKQNDDGKNYVDFLLNAKPHILPSYKIHSLVTSRLEKYRSYTEQWLKKHNILYENLIMLDLPDKDSRLKLNAHAAHKAAYYKKSSNLEIFQAKEVNLNLNFFESDLDLNLKSSMINGLANSNTLKAFEPIISIKDSISSIKMYSKSAEIIYDKNMIIIPDEFQFNGLFENQIFSGKGNKLEIDLSENLLFILGDFNFKFKSEEYFGKNISLDLEKKIIIGSEEFKIRKSKWA